MFGLLHTIRFRRIVTAVGNASRRRLFVYALLMVIHLAIAVVFLSDRAPMTDAAVTGFPLDDAWIHLVYGHSLAHYGLPYYNVGVMEAGFTSPLWMVVLAFAEWVSLLFALPIVIVVKAVGIICAWTASVALYELCRRFIASELLCLIAGVFAATNATIAFSQLSGMEICLAAALALFAVIALEREQYWKCGALLALAYLARPESLVLTLLVVTACSVSSLSQRFKYWLLNFLKLVVPVGVAGALWVSYCVSVSGHVLPNTYYAKHSSALAGSGTVNLLTEVVLKYPSALAGTGMILALLGMVAMWIRRQPPSMVLLIYPWLFLASIAYTRPMPAGCGTYFYWLRYIVPALPFLIFLTVAGADLLWNAQECLKRSGIGVARQRILRIISVVLLILAVAKYPADLGFRKSQFAWNCQNMNEVQVELGKWVKQNTPQDAVILVNDAGAIRYFGERKTDDVLGLNSYSLLFDTATQESICYQAGELEKYMKSHGAEFYIVFPSCFPSIMNSELFKTDFTPLVYFQSKHYTIAEASQDVMVAFKLNK